MGKKTAHGTEGAVADNDLSVFLNKESIENVVWIAIFILCEGEGGMGYISPRTSIPMARTGWEESRTWLLLSPVRLCSFFYG
jgi:hypothetical protein